MDNEPEYVIQDIRIALRRLLKHDAWLDVPEKRVAVRQTYGPDNQLYEIIWDRVSDEVISRLIPYTEKWGGDDFRILNPKGTTAARAAEEELGIEARLQAEYLWGIPGDKATFGMYDVSGPIIWLNREPIQLPQTFVPFLESASTL